MPQGLLKTSKQAKKGLIENQPKKQIDKKKNQQKTNTPVMAKLNPAQKMFRKIEGERTRSLEAEIGQKIFKESGNLSLLRTEVLQTQQKAQKQKNKAEKKKKDKEKEAAQKS
eukprot:TRINITY_DN1079_c0_g1_i2.p1 TRINITY_DN1079_c0_g1~~TRINITY_DN1079_c0_g1_i2.p1  ORF type:complete len:112 (-),score=39.42 TRINITY_DN1079_c0_g1_i2:143-478(-)